MKLFITGGHITPALALIEELHNEYPNWEIIIVGRKYAFETDAFFSEEYKLVTQKGLRFLPITTGRLTKILSLFTFISLAKIPIGFIQAFVYCLTQRPHAIISFGGYVAFPVVFCGWLLGIPSLIHEQTRHPGLTNRILSFFARRVCITYPQSLQYFPKKKVIYTGLPIRKRLFSSPRKNPFRIWLDMPLVYITGGSTGSLSVNKIVFRSVSRLTRKYSIIHQTGRLSYNEALRIKNDLSEELQNRYFPVVYLDENDLAWVYKNAQIIISRGGANTVQEIAALGKVAIFIPLPWARNDEQRKNVQFLVRKGTSVLLDQLHLTTKNLIIALSRCIKKLSTMRENAQFVAHTMPRDSARKIISQIVKYFS